MKALAGATMRPARLFLLIPVIACSEVARLTFSLVARETVPFLQLPCQLLATSFQLVDIVVREFPPLFFDLALELFPSARGAIVVHDVQTPVLSVVMDKGASAVPYDASRFDHRKFDYRVCANAVGLNRLRPTSERACRRCLGALSRAECGA